MATASFADMAQAVRQLIDLKRGHLLELENMSRQLGVEPAPDLAFAGIRVMLARAAEAETLIRSLARFEDDVRAWLTELGRVQKMDEADGLTAGLL